jgi:hypothetical protein
VLAIWSVYMHKTLEGSRRLVVRIAKNH